MLENVKSQYILKIIFLPITEKIKLNLIRYNINLQSKLDIKLLNYKIFSGNYSIINEYIKKEKYMMNMKIELYLKENF